MPPNPLRVKCLKSGHWWPPNKTSTRRGEYAALAMQALGGQCEESNAHLREEKFAPILWALEWITGGNWRGLFNGRS